MASVPHHSTTCAHVHDAVAHHTIEARGVEAQAAAHAPRTYCVQLCVCRARCGFIAGPHQVICRSPRGPPPAGGAH